jgi:DNA-binding transcriptional regulator YbjK
MPDADAPDLDAIDDGRRRKGERRRRALLAATLRVIDRGGLVAVSQRSVAAEAGLPPSAVTYYHPTVDDLLVATLTAANDRYVHALETLPEDDDAALVTLAEIIATAAGPDRASALAEYELWLLAARRPDLHAELERWNRALDALAARFTHDPVARAAFAAVVDGLLIRAVVSAAPPDPHATRAVLDQVLRR